MLKRLSLILVALAFCPGHLPACTLWAAAGADANGGTVISKNRDWKPDHTQRLKLVRPKAGLAYFGLYAEGNDDPGLKAGINEKGLTIISASTHLPKKLLNNQPGKHGVMAKILAEYASIDALVADAGKVFGLARASFFMLADRNEILVVEVGLDGQYSYHTVNKGFTAHTNHYLDPRFAEFYTDKVGISSVTRLARIDELLRQTQPPFTLAQFSVMSRDQRDGPDNSLWRSGKVRTMASWMVDSPAIGPQMLRVVINNPGQAEILQKFVLDEAFWRTCCLPVAGLDC